MERGRARERAGDPVGAAEAYLAAGSEADAIRVLSEAGRYADAARIALSPLGAKIGSLDRASEADRKRAFRAAVLLGQAADHERAANLFRALGDREREADQRARAATGKTVVVTPAPQPRSSVGEPRTLEASGDLEGAAAAYQLRGQPGDAARVLRAMKRFEEAAKLYAKAGMPYEAAISFHDAQRPAECLDQLLHVGREHPRYRAAAAQVLKLAHQQNSLDFRVDQAVAAFLATKPENDREVEAFYLGAEYYERQGVSELAARALAEVLARVPDHPQARELAARVRTDAVAELPDLPELPPIEGLAATPVARRGGTEIHHAAPVEAVTALPVGELTPGTVVSGRYRIEQLIGQGGLAAVYRAVDLELDEAIAMKVFAPGQETNELITRFKQELQLSRQLSHPNIVRLHDLGSHAGTRYLTMELLRGHDLERLLALHGGPFEPKRAIGYVLQAAAGLHEAHGRGIIHRDVKLENFFVTDEDVLKVMDFGIAKRKNAPGVTMQGFLAGTPAYIAPEQITNFATVTHAADLYALGVVAFRLLTGAYPFEDPELVPLLMMHATKPPPTLRAFNPSVPEVLEPIVAKLLSKTPALRYASCRDLGVALQQARRSLVLRERAALRTATRGACADRRGRPRRARARSRGRACEAPPRRLETSTAARRRPSLRAPSRPTPSSRRSARTSSCYPCERGFSRAGRCSLTS